MPYSVKGFFEINEDMVQILLMLEVLFTQDSKVEDLFCGASSGSEPSLFFSNYQLVKDLTSEKQGRSSTIQGRPGKCVTEEQEILSRWIEYCS